MNRIFLITVTVVMSLGLLSSFTTSPGPSYGLQNQTSNTTSTQQSQGGQQQQQNQTEDVASASQIENMTAGNIPILGNEIDIENQNDTSVTQGMQKEQVTTDSNMTNNQTGGGGTTNETTGSSGNQTQAGDNQTAKSPLEQLGETISGIFAGGNQSN
jgi:hypothetical protein